MSLIGKDGEMEDLKFIYNIVTSLLEIVAVIYVTWIIAWEYPKLEKRVEELEKK